MNIVKRQLAVFERDVKPEDHFGTQASTWEEVCKAFGSLEPLSGRELFAAQQVQSQTTHKWRMHHMPGTKITSDLRMKIGEREFQIESVVNVNEANRELELMVVEQ